MEGKEEVSMLEVSSGSSFKNVSCINQKKLVNEEKRVKASTAFSLKNEPFLDNDSLKLLEAADFSSLTHL